MEKACGTAQGLKFMGLLKRSGADQKKWLGLPDGEVVVPLGQYSRALWVIRQSLALKPEALKPGQIVVVGLGCIQCAVAPRCHKP